MPFLLPLRLLISTLLFACVGIAANLHAAIPANGPSEGYPRINPTGQFIAFHSAASNLVPNDSNFVEDVFVFDRLRNTFTCVSVDANGVPVGGFHSSISANGRFVAFASESPNLVAGDVNGLIDIFVRDLQTRTTFLVSVSSTGVQSDDLSERAALSDDGQFVVFESVASTLVTGDSNGERDIFLHNIGTGTTTRVSVNSSGTQSNGNSFNASVSGNGARVVFQSSANNLVAADSNGLDDVFLREGGVTTRISVDDAGTQGFGSSQDPDISADGRFVSFESNASNLVAGDGNNEYDIFVHDLQLATTVRVSVNSFGQEGLGGGSFFSQIGDGGRFIAFESFANNLVGADTNSVRDVFLRDQIAGTTIRLSVNNSGAQANQSSVGADVSADGSVATFSSLASNLTPADMNASADIFTHQAGNSNTEIITVQGDAVGGQQARYECESTVSDSSGNDRHLNPVFGAAQYASDAYSGFSCQFDGATQLRSDLAAFAPSNDFSVSFWMRDATATGQETIMQTVPNATVSTVINSIDMDSQRLRIWGDNSAFPFTISQSDPSLLNDGGWHHVVISAAGSNASVKMYVDGAPLGSSVLGIPSVVNLATTFFLGARSDLNNASSANYLGLLDEIILFNRVLHPIDIAEITAKPGMSRIADFAINEDTTSTNFPFTVRDLITPSSALQVNVVASSDPSVIPVAAVTLGGSGTNRTLSVTPLPQQSGLVQITLELADQDNNVDVQNFLVTVNAVNDPPTVSLINDISLNEDTPSAPISFTIGDLETTVGSLNVIAGSDNPTLIPGGNIVIGGSGANRTVTITPAPNQFGTANFQVIVDDGQVSTTEGFVVTVNPVNDAPTVTAIGPVTIDEDTVSAPIAFTVGDVETLPGALLVSASSNNPTLLPPAGINLATTGANFTLSLEPAADQFGSATVTVAVSDGTDTSTSTFLLTVTGINDAPSVSAIADLSLNEDTPSAPITFTIADSDTAIGSVNVISGSDNPTLFPGANIAFGGSGANRSITITPAANQFGIANFQVIADDGQFSTVENFIVTVSPVNDAPTVTAIGPVTIDEDTISAPIAFTIDDVETPAGALLVNVSSNNLTLLPPANINLSTTNGANINLILEPAADQFGTATVSISVGDGSNTTTTTFLLTVTGLNDAPSISAISNFNMAEDGTSAPIAINIADSDNPLASLNVIAGSDNPALFPTAGVVLGGSGGNRTLTLTPAPNQFGTANFQVTVDDGQLSATQSFVVTVSAVNDLPSFTITANHVAPPNTTSAQTVPNWASSIDDGDPQAQNVSFNVSFNATPGMFSIPPSLSANGTLTYTPSGLPGLATLSVSLSDDATAGGPALTTAIQTASIIVQGTIQMTVQATPSSVVFGQPYSARIAVLNAASSLVPTGQVRLRPLPAGTPVVCNLSPSTPAGNAQADCNVPSPAAPTDKLLQADYLGDSIFVAGRGFGVINVAPAATQISVLSDTPDPSTSNTPVTLRYQVQVLSPSLAPLSSLRGTIVARAGDVEIRAPYSQSNPEIVITPQGNGSVPITLSYVDDNNFENSSVIEPHTLAGGGTTDLAVLLSNGQNFVTGGARAMYVIRIDNLGSVSSNAQLDAALPVGLANASWTCSASTGSLCQLPSGTGGIVAVNTIAAGGFVNYMVGADVTALEGAMLSYQARITPAATPPDSNPANNESTDRDIVTLYINGFE